ncbi:MAG TPA: twin-arginine translocase TatA/TatE family subunit [Pirellulales bacterium]|nr:twin-arginine translocase TatA/TatE family subunit [Pirellulales bacterium]
MSFYQRQSASFPVLCVRAVDRCDFAFPCPPLSRPDANMGTLSIWHLLVIAFIILLLFGNRLPSVMRSLGEGVVEFKKGMQGIEDDKNQSKEKEKIE